MVDKKQCGCTEANCEILWKVFSVVIVILTLVVVIISVIFVAQQDALQRFCLIATSSEVVGGPGEAGARLWGMLQLDSNDNRLIYQFRRNGALSAADVTAIHLKGPIPMGIETGPIAAILCGGPGSYMPACDNTNPAAVPKTIVNQVYNGISSTATDVRNLIREVRVDPSLYYVEVLTTSIPASPGAVRAPLQGTCGTP